MTPDADTWYWITDSRVGDFWTPVYVRKDGTSMIDGLVYATESLMKFTWVKAVMPEKSNH